MRKKNTSLKKDTLSLDLIIFILGIILLAGLILFLARGNLEFDSLNYYSGFSKWLGKDEIYTNAFVQGNIFPYGYQAISLPAYYGLTYVATPFIQTNVIESPLVFHKREGLYFPYQEIKMIDWVFHNYRLTSGYIIEWAMILALAITSYFFFFIGIFSIAATLRYIYGKEAKLSIIIIGIFACPFFLHNVLNTPLYATLVLFGLSSIFVYLVVRMYQEVKHTLALFAGLVLGILFLVRIEAVIFFVLTYFFMSHKKYWLIRNYFASGFILTGSIVFILNYINYHNPFYFYFFNNNLNYFGINLYYIFLNLIGPYSGIFLYSLPILAGLWYLSKMKTPFVKTFLFSGIILILICIVRLNTFYDYHTPALDLVGIVFHYDSAVELISYDINRYMVILFPMAIIGLHQLYLWGLEEKKKLLSGGLFEKK